MSNWKLEVEYLNEGREDFYCGNEEQLMHLIQGLDMGFIFHFSVTRH